jgi:hypothetical protein
VCGSFLVKYAAVTRQEPIIKNYAVLPLSQMRLVSRDFTGYIPAELNAADFLIIEDKLNEFATQYNLEAERRAQEWIKRVPALKHRKANPVMKLLNYKRQYVCGVDAKGDKIIWVNCFCNDCKECSSYWKKQLVFVMDGGACYFNLKINLTKKIRYDVMVNGIA